MRTLSIDMLISSSKKNCPTCDNRPGVKVPFSGCTTHSGNTFVWMCVARPV